MNDNSGGSSIWVGVALIFVGMVGKDLFISDEGELKINNFRFLSSFVR